MPTLSRRSFDEYRALLDVIEERSVSGFSEKATYWAPFFMNAGNEDIRALYRSAIVGEVYSRIDSARAQAEARADDLFVAMVDEDPAPHSAFPYEAADRRVRSAAVHLFERGDVRGFVHVLESFIREEVRGAASNAIAENVEEANSR